MRIMGHDQSSVLTCRSPWPSPLKVTEGGVGCKVILILDPGHSRSSMASFRAADYINARGLEYMCASERLKQHFTTSSYNMH